VGHSVLKERAAPGEFCHSKKGRPRLRSEARKAA
jgi:hypothetical protein